jgi:hypothetical protein
MTCLQVNIKSAFQNLQETMQSPCDDHLTTFLKFVDDLEVEYEDVVMKMYMQTLEGNA